MKSLNYQIKKTPKLRNGFTLVELLVVLAIIGILAVILLAAFRNSQRRSRDAQRKADLKEISNSLEMFYSDHRLYPTDNNGSGNIWACEWDATPQECNWGAGPLADGNTIYFRILPKDPINSQNYYYRVPDATNPQGYQLYAHLENPEDKSCFEINGLPNCTDPHPDLPILPDSCGGVCNFAITSPNISAFD